MRSPVLRAVGALSLLLALTSISPWRTAEAARPTRGKARVTFYCRSCSPGKRVADPRRRVTDPGGVAADPRYHPLGSRVYIEGFGTRRVDDTGGAIKGPNRFDVRLASRGRCHRYGVKRLQYRVVSRPKNKRQRSR